MIGADVQPGASFPALNADAISRGKLALFAGASGDHNPLHIDSDVAQSAGFDDVFAHGMLSMAYLGRWLTSLVPQERLVSFSTRFTAITPIHGEPSCSGFVRSVDLVDGEPRATLELTVTLADHTATLTGVAVVRLA